MTIDDAFARRFARDWIAAWNSRDLERVLAYYADDVEMVSPLIVAVTGDAGGGLRGKIAVGAYWAKALERLPVLYMELREVFVGIGSVMIRYRGPRGESAETFFFDDDGKVCKAVAHYLPE